MTMINNVFLNEKIEQELIKITKKTNTNEAIKELVKRELLRKKNKYTYLIKNFEKKYNMKFEDFEEFYKNKKSDYEIEKIYFEWDMAVTACEDIEEELEGIR